MNALPIEKVNVSAYTIPTDQPESDGTYKWDSTTIVIVEVEAGDQKSLGYTYADEATARLIESKLRDVVTGRDAMSPNECFRRHDQVDPQSRAAGHLLDGHLGRRHCALGFEGATARICRSSGCSVRCARPCRSTAAADSLPIRTTSCRNSWAAGRSRGFRASR